MSQLLELSAGILDGTTDPDGTGPVNRINFQLSSITDRVALVEAFSHCVLFETDDGLLGFDTSSVQGGE
ncbi:MAG: MBL fold metallo-hydrolase, partial [Gammaproteobacteria bacterium]|nr:MBL fold metallo-hydrolase [Gammaproteobacteria bacterium]